MFNANGNVAKSTQFNPVGKYSKSETEGSLDPKGNRRTKLGVNMYVQIFNFNVLNVSKWTTESYPLYKKKLPTFTIIFY